MTFLDPETNHPFKVKLLAVRVPTPRTCPSSDSGDPSGQVVTQKAWLWFGSSNLYVLVEGIVPGGNAAPSLGSIKKILALRSGANRWDLLAVCASK